MQTCASYYRTDRMRIVLRVVLTAAVLDASVGAVTSPTSAAQPSAANVPYLIGRGPCIAIEEGRAVDTGTHLLEIVSGKGPVDVTVEELRPWTGRSFGGPRRPLTDCTAWFEEDVTDDPGDGQVRVTALARMSISPDEGEAFFALPPQPARLIVGGAPRIVGPAERRQLFETVRSSLPTSWTAARTLVRAQRYGPTGGHQIIELAVAYPTRNPRGVTPPIKHIAIRRFFVVDGRVAASEDYERASGVEEHAELEAPQLP